MAGPLEAVRYIHSPMRRDLQEMAGHAHHMDEGAPTDETKHHLSELQQRYALWSRIVDVHEDAEEQFLFSALDAAVPGTSAAYQEAHR